MRKVIVCAWVAFSSFLPINNVVSAGEGIVNTGEYELAKKIEGAYNAIDFGACAKPDYAVFEKAYTGYLNLAATGELNANKKVLTICDLSMSANTNRMWIIDLENNKVIMNTYVAHGQGSGEEFANKFSNKMNSHQTSLGFYITGDTYIGEHGNSLYLHGMDKGFNHLAYQRNIVVHGARYVNSKYIAANQRLGRSWGCPAVAQELSDKIIREIKDGTCLFVYYPQQQYLQKSVWLNKRGMGVTNPTLLASATKTQVPAIVYEYGPTGQKIGNAISQIKLPLF